MGSAERRPASDEARQAEINDSIIPDVGFESQHADDPWLDGESEPLGPSGSSGSSGSSGLSSEQPLPRDPAAPSDPDAPSASSGQSDDKEVHPPSHEEVFRLAIRLHRVPSLESDELLDIVRQKYPKLSLDDVELVATELEEKIGKVDPGKQRLPRALEEASTSPPPPEADRYPDRPHLRQFIGLIDVLTDEEGVIVIAQEPFAELLSVNRSMVRNMIRRLIKDGLLAIHTLPDRTTKPFRATTYIWRPRPTAEEHHNDPDDDIPF